MQLDLSNLNEDALKELYDKEEAELTSLLLNGALWEEVREKRHRLTQLGIALYKKRNFRHFSHPAASDIRSSDPTP
jgi:hypothetical protein